MSLNKKLLECVEDAIENAKEDRLLASQFITILKNEIEELKDDDQYVAGDNATGASNLLNALQRSNEQIIKAGDLIRKYKKEKDDESMSSKEIYDELEEIDEEVELDFQDDAPGDD